MGRIRTNKQYIVPGALISASYVSDLYDLVTANIYEDSAFSGSLSVTGSIYGNLIGTASFATQASQSFSASFATAALSSSYAFSASYSSHALSASYAPNTGVTKIVAGTNVSISPASGIGDITISALGNQGDGTVDFAVTSGSAEYLSVPNKLVLGGVVMIDLGELPTADPHNAGQLWRSGNFVMVSLG
jgi:hypothetical protein